MVTRVLLLARVQFTHGVFLREKRSKAELWASRSVGPRLKTDVLSRATGKHNSSLSTIAVTTTSSRCRTH